MYYPFAGRFKDQVSIECNDEGVTLLITRTKHALSDILKNPNPQFMDPLFADELQWKEIDPRGTILAVQINCFACGGMAIRDAATLFNFVKDWAAITTKSDKSQITFPNLNGGSILPIGDLPNYPEVMFVNDNNVVCKRFVFEASKIESLKAMVSSSSSSRNPTRVQVVSALIHKSAISAMNKPSLWLRFAANLRTRTDPPMPAKTVGNMVWFFFVPGTRRDELREVVSQTQERMSEFREVCAGKFGRNDVSFISECLKTATSSGGNDEEMVMFYVASWCRFGVYEGDFGWGKPIWVTTSGCPVKNSVVLVDTRDGDGIEALVNMEENDMALFERDVQLGMFASINPSIM
ncbi:acylsugar acyltransferase 3-like [Senna tora]|uniref:Acylsugar acyltransferase 3-like n=1 Tax=Senna tora TaxID=362788 RepID=A0A835CFQ0_9FABA|nr:acylsugar acyltransferase 3-like [Senna tora]